LRTSYSAALRNWKNFHLLGRPGRKPGTREWVSSPLPYIVVYRVRKEVVEIVRILHGAQRWPR
jgi:plasmid stabilization system protein ParE